MKIWCDVCSKKQASVFCSADEAALCDDCDQRVHQANKLASKHLRFSLLQPSSSQHLPHCDICQEKKALLFCQEDRAILCRDCDVPLHTSNEHTQKHNRFLLTGAKLSELSSSNTTTTKNKAKSTDPLKSGFDQVPDFRSKSLTTKRPFLSSSPSQTINPQLYFKPQATDAFTISQEVNNHQLTYGGEGGSTSSISEYLIEMLPGWQVEDLLDSSSDPVGFAKVGGDDLLFMNANLGSRFGSYESNVSWVPQAPIIPQSLPYNPSFGMVNGTEGTKGDVGRKTYKNMMNDAFTVPQINPYSVDFKRYRHAC